MDHNETQRLLQRLPLPLAQLLRRALNGKSSLERHHNALYLAEAALKLGASMRIGIWLEHGLERGSTLARNMEALLLPSLGHWLGLLRDCDRVLGERPDRELLPMGGALGSLNGKLGDAGSQALHALVTACVEAGVFQQDQVRSAGRDGLIGGLTLMVSYRNTVLGHGAQRWASFYDQLAPLLLELVCQLVADRRLLGGLELALPQRTANTEPARDGDPALRWRTLAGPVGLPMDPGLEARLGDHSQVIPGRLYAAAPGALIPLFPLLIYREDAFENEVVGLLNKTVRRTRSTEAGQVQEIRRADYLDYASGQNLPGIDAEPALTSLLERLRGRDLDSAERARIRSETLADTADEPEEDVVASGAAIGDFEIIETLGRGGMAIVYRARQRTLGREVALKVLPPTLATDPVAEARFAQEIAALARCDHPNVVRVFSSGRQADRSFYAMELVDGADLAAVGSVLTSWRAEDTQLREGHIAAAVTRSERSRPNLSDAEGFHPTSPPSGAADPGSAAAELMGPAPEIHAGRSHFDRLAELFADAALGLQHLHDQDVIHRDVKPGNLMLTADGQRVVVMDLGLARLTDASHGLTRSEVKVLGTLRYMAPEQLERQRARIDHRVDVYGLGATLYELATGHPVHQAETEAALIREVLEQPPRAPRRVEPSVPRDLATIITVACAKDPAHRYPSARALAEDLRAFAEHRPIKAAPPGPLHAVRLLARRQKVASALLGAGLLASLIGVGAYATWARTSVQLCEDTEERWGVMACLRPISVEHQAQREESFRIESSKGRVRRVAKINAAGICTEDEGACSWALDYDQQGRIQRMQAFDRLGTILHQWVYPDGPKRAERRDRFGNPAALPDTDVYVRVFSLDAEGRPVTQRGENLFGMPRIDADKVFGWSWERDGQGWSIRRTALTADGEPMPAGDGVTTTRYVYGDDHGRVIEERYQDADGRPITDSRSAASLHRDYDTHGNLVGEALLDLEGELVAGDEGWATRRLDRDETGNPTLTSYFDEEGNPVRREGEAAAERRAFDAQGRLVALTYLNEEGDSTTGDDGWATRTSIFDERGNYIEDRYLAVDGEATLHVRGYAQRERDFNEEGFITEFRYYDADGNPTMRSDLLCVRIQQDYNVRGQIVEGRCLDEMGLPQRSKSAWAAYRREYDERGRHVSTHYLGPDREPIAVSGGKASLRYDYDDYGRIRKTSFFGIDGLPARTEDGQAGCGHRYDEQGNMVEQVCVDEQGQPTWRKQGYASFTWAYDERGNIIERRVYGPDGQPATFPAGEHFERDWYDEQGHEVRRAHFDAEDRPTTVKEGYSRSQKRYDRFGNDLEWRYFDQDGEPTLTRDGYAVIRKERDSRGHLVRMEYFGLQDQPVRSREGCASYTYAYDDRNNETRKSCLGPDGEPSWHEDGWATRTKIWDPRGWLLEQSHLDPKGQPTLDSNGAATYRYRYDARGNQLDVTYLGTDGQPVTGADGWSTMRRDYDERDRKVREGYHDLAGEPVISQNSGSASITYSYDDRGNMSYRAFFDERGAPTPSNWDGCAAEVWENDLYGRLATWRCLDGKGDGIAASNGWAIMMFRYDHRGNTVEVEGLDPHGHPAKHADWGGSRYTREHDGHGNITSELYFGPDGQPILNKRDGVARYDLEWDTRGNRTALIGYGLDGELREDTGGGARYEYSYDRLGNRTEKRVLDSRGRPALHKGACARMTYRYDPWGREITRACYGLLEEPRLDEQGCPRTMKRYSARGDQISQLCLGLDGQPKRDIDDQFGWRRGYDEQGALGEKLDLDLTEAKAQLER